MNGKDIKSKGHLHGDKGPGDIKERPGECRERSGGMEAFEGVWDSLDSFEAVDPSPCFRTRLKSRIAEMENDKRFVPWFRRLFRPIPVAGALLLLIIGLYSTNYYYSHRFIFMPDKVAMYGSLDMLIEYDLIDNLDILDDFDVINSLEI